MTQTRFSYHHGDLRNALIIAAAELIERDGTLEFSMAEAASGLLPFNLSNCPLTFLLRKFSSIAIVCS